MEILDVIGEDSPSKIVEKKGFYPGVSIAIEIDGFLQ